MRDDAEGHELAVLRERSRHGRGLLKRRDIANHMIRRRHHEDGLGIDLDAP